MTVNTVINFQKTPDAALQPPPSTGKDSLSPFTAIGAAAAQSNPPSSIPVASRAAAAAAPLLLIRPSNADATQLYAPRRRLNSRAAHPSDFFLPSLRRSPSLIDPTNRHPSAFSPVVSIRRSPSLIDKTNKHRALAAYEGLSIPSGTSIFLASHVYDGVGDLEHLIHAAKHLLPQRQAGRIKLYCWLNRGNDVPEKAWQTKLTELFKMGLDGVYWINSTEPDTDAHTVAITREVEQIVSREHSCVIFVSTTTASVPGYENSINWVTEYEHYDNLLDTWMYLLAGFQTGTFGVWLNDDSVFRAPSPPSDRAKQLLFGSALSDQEMEGWEVGFASLREDPARYTWAGLRTSQVKPGKNCTLVVSPFNSVDKEIQYLAGIANLSKFDRCVIVDRNGETVVKEGNGSSSRILRIVHQFVDEEDLPSVIQLSHGGSLGGAGDTATVRGLIGEYPVFVECRPETISRWQAAIRYFRSKNLFHLADWFSACMAKNTAKLLQLSKNEAVIQEWREFQQLARQELDIGHAFDLYVVRSVIHQCNRSIQQVELALLQGRISYGDYRMNVLRELSIGQI